MTPRQYQIDAVNATVSYLKYPHRHPLIAIPTGAGKTLCIAMLIGKIKEKKPDYSILVLSHVQEILDQNYKRIKEHLDRDVSLFSSGLGQKEIGDITVAGVQSIWREANRFSHVDIIIIDEAHSISTDEGTMYDVLFKATKAQRIGFSATPFRLRDGLIYGAGKQFTELAYDLTSADAFVGLVNAGYLSKLVTKGTKLKLDTDGIKEIGGDFSEKEMSKRFDKLTITRKAIDEIIERGHDRKKWLIFAIDISHAEHIAECLLRKGIMTNVVHSKMVCDRKTVIEDYKNGKYRAIVNVNVLTTGFDDPTIDLVALLRPTKSPVLHVQTIGRGSRVHPDKRDCLILDFAGNISRLGAINDIKIKEKGKGKTGADPVMKECPACMLLVAPAVRNCPDCGHEFTFKTLIVDEASDEEVVTTRDKSIKFYDVDAVFYQINKRQGSPSTIKVSYLCGAKTFNEWICVEHIGYAKHKANHWIKFRGGSPCDTVEEFMRIHSTLKVAKRIKVVKKGLYPIIEECYF